MPRDERKRQKALMKQRSKQKAAAQHKAQQQILTPSSPKAILRHAHSYHLYECLISDNHMIYQSIEYAEQFGFEPEKDFTLSQYLLAPRGELEESYKLTFGKDGKPLFISGPHDNVGRILRQLDKTAGPGNYEYLAMLGSEQFDDFDDDDDIF